MRHEAGQRSKRTWSPEANQCARSYALHDLDTTCKLRHSISFGDVDQLSGLASDGAHAEAQRTPGRQPTNPAPGDDGKASYTCSMLFKPSNVRTSRNILQTACLHASTFPHLPGAEPPMADVSTVEPAAASPTSSLFSRLSFLAFSQSSQEKPGAGAEEYQPHPLTRSVSEAMLPSLGQSAPIDSACRASSLRRERSPTRFASGARAHSCAHPLTRFDFTDSESSTPTLSPRAPKGAAAQPMRPRSFNSWQDDTHLSVRTCELSDAQDSPLASPTSQLSLSSFFSGLLPYLTTSDSSSREASGSVGDSSSLGTGGMDSLGEYPDRPLSSERGPHPISSTTCRSMPVLVQHDDTAGAPYLHKSGSAPAEVDVRLPSWPLNPETVPGESVVHSFYMMDTEGEKYAVSPQTSLGSDAPAVPEDLKTLVTAVSNEVSGLVCGGNTSAAVKNAVPEDLLKQLIGMLGAEGHSPTAQAAGVRAAVGADKLCGLSEHAVGQFELVQTTVDKSTGIMFTCEKQTLRKRLHMYRTRFRIPDASIESMQTYMLNDHIVRSSNASMLSYVRLEDPSLGPETAHSLLSLDQNQAADSGFMYSKIKFPVIGARQYVSCRRVWLQPEGQGFYIVSTSCQQPGIVAQAQALDDAQGLGDKAWSTDFWAGYMVREYDDSGVKGVEVSSITFDDLGVPAFLANNASVPGLWAGAKSFTEGYRAFEQTLASCRVSGEDIFAAVDEIGNGAQTADSGSHNGCRRLRRAALFCLTGALVLIRGR